MAPNEVRERGRGSAVISWLRTTDWLWMIIAGFYLIAYLFWYVPALAAFPRSLSDPPEQFPWHWALDFVVTALTGGVLLFLGFRRATEFATGGEDRRASQGSGAVERSGGGDSGTE